MPATPSIRRSRNSMATCRSASPPPRRICCSSRSNSTASRTLCSNGAWRCDAGHYRPWFEDCARPSPTSSTTRRRAAVPREIGDRRLGLEPAVRRDHGGAAFEVDGEELPIEPTLNLLQDRTRRSARRRSRRWRRRFNANERLFTHITNTLAKDKEISDRWRGFKDIADSGTSNNSVEREVVDALVARCARPIRGCRTAITR
jgi:hypothetical protein